MPLFSGFAQEVSVDEHIRIHIKACFMSERLGPEIPLAVLEQVHLQYIDVRSAKNGITAEIYDELDLMLKKSQLEFQKRLDKAQLEYPSNPANTIYFNEID